MDIKPKVRINVNVDKDDKEMATKLFNEMGLNMNTAINMFIKQTIKERGLPFKPKAQTKLDRAIQEVKNGDTTTFNSFEEWEKDLDSDE